MAWLGLVLFTLPTWTVVLEAHVVRTTSGWIRGETREMDSVPIYHYRGIPYAEPPVGQLRFRAPVAVRPWDGIYNATTYGPSCPQDITAVPIFYPDYVVRIPKTAQNISEDCLTLNIFVPAFSKKGGSGLAVMFWIHGGAFETGQGSGYDASALAVRGGVVVVTINYRLNVFGFLTTNDDNAPGNYGFLDQQLALLWVHENIAAFGGDPSRVTLFGQSAGGASVSLHIYANNSRPLFHRAAAHSGYTDPSFISALGGILTYYAHETARAVGCDSTLSSDIVYCLRERPMEELLAAGLHVTSEATRQIWLPIDDDDTFSLSTESFDLSHDFMVLFTSGDGSVALEVIKNFLPGNYNFSVGVTEEQWEAWLQIYTKYYGPIKLIQPAVDFQYTNKPLVDRDFARMEGLVEMVLDRNYLIFLESFLRDLPNSPSIHMAIFDHRCTANTRYPRLNLVSHSEEIPFLFGLPFNGSGIGQLFTDEEKTLSDRVITYWSNFAKSG